MRRNVFISPFKCILILAFLSSAASLLYEMSMAKCLSQLMDDSSVWESLSLGFYMAGFSCGVLVRQGKGRVESQFFKVQASLICLGASSVLLTIFLHIVYRIYFYDYGFSRGEAWIVRPLHQFAMLAEGLVFAIGFMSGLEWRLLLKIQRVKASLVESPLYLIWSAYYFGALAASLIFILILNPHVSMVQAGLLAAFVHLIALGIFLFEFNRKSAILRVSGLSVLLLLGLIFSPVLENLQIKNFYYNFLALQNSSQTGIEWLGPVPLSELYSFLKKIPDVERVRSPYQFIDMTKSVENTGHGSEEKPTVEGYFEHTLFLNGHYQYDTRRERDYHEHLAHVPFLLTSRFPDKVLVLGAGDGLLLRELLKHKKNPLDLTLVELDAGMVQLAQRPPLAHLNQNSLRDPRVRVEVADAFLWLQKNKEQFSSIFVDFPFPFDGEGMRLYSLEFFRLLHKTLAPGGFMVMDAPFHHSPRTDEARRNLFDNDRLMSSLYGGGFRSLFGFKSMGEGFLIGFAELTQLPILPMSRPHLSRETLDYWESLSLKALSLDDWFVEDPPFVNLLGGKPPPGIESANSIFKPMSLVQSDRAF